MTGTIEKSAKLSDVARAAGVSQGTVSNVFNRPGLVREEVREHVHEIARRLGYRGPDPKGRLLRAGKVNAIGIATAEPLTYFFEDPYARAVMAGIAETADAAGAGISLVSAANDEALAWNIQSALVDGFVLFCIEGGERLVRLTRERQLPFIALALGTENDSVATVGVDSLAGGRLAAEHLVGLGHRKFAVVALPVRPGHGESGPITLADVAGRKITTGGGFFRLFPAAITDRAVARANRDEGRPAVFYFHPWEVDPEQPRVARAPLKSRLRHYSRLGAMAGKLRGLVKRHDWGRVDAVVAAEAERLQ